MGTLTVTVDVQSSLSPGNTVYTQEIKIEVLDCLAESYTLTSAPTVLTKEWRFAFDDEIIFTEEAVFTEPIAKKTCSVAFLRVTCEDNQRNLLTEFPTTSHTV